MGCLLTNIANKYHLDKGTMTPQSTKWYHQYPDHSTMGYTEIYHQYMGSHREDVSKFLEVGIYDPRFPGDSLKMWYEYFPNAEIWGVDNFWGNETSPEIIGAMTTDRTNIFIADQSNRSDMALLFEKAGGGFDFMIEDGAHWPSHMMINLVCCFPHLKSGGVYFMEDLQPQSRVGVGAYDNWQITNLWKEFIATSYLARLYITRQEHKELLDSIENVKMFNCNDVYLLAITKK